MIDVIVYCPDMTALEAELETKGFEQIPFPKTPTKQTGDEGMALVRISDVSEINAWASLSVLGTYDEVFADPDLLAIYDRIYPRTPVTFTDDNGEECTYTPSDKFGVFA